ncbi:hypothetical protein E5288_WYG017796 [Bos mutus]|uniref:Uncharacterized protein n=1 Tax=Bos mutus TaxID=72004 RepID=A0A6B0RCE4_9CETA|nr:hypothetical protein [Bos mutus]
MLPASPRAAGGFDNFFPVQEGEGPGWEGGSSPFLPVSPEVIKRRRGGLIEQRDIIKAHEAHKMQSTPQARRKEWERTRDEISEATWLRLSPVPSRSSPLPVFPIVEDDYENGFDTF